MNNTNNSALSQRLSRIKNNLKPVSGIQIEGKLVRMVGLTLEAVGCNAPIGTICHVYKNDTDYITAEVVGFNDGKMYLMPTGDTSGLAPNAKVITVNESATYPVGKELVGRVIDAKGNPLDNLGAILTTEKVSLNGKIINPLEKSIIKTPLDVGVRAINSLMTIGRGQRMGLFAGSGVGKSVLLGMMTRYTKADIIVVGLIGERGREVKEFIENILGAEGMSRSIIVASPADNPPLTRLHGAMYATSIAEYFRDQGANVLLLMDSLTRFAQAQRELALAIGEPPATKGYPPSVFAKIPQLVERTGNGPNNHGSITAIYTVLTEGDDQQDPVADSARAILDGHIVLSRKLAESGHYPAIDVEASISRAMQNIVDNQQLSLAQKFKSVYSKYLDSKDLINVGAYNSGSDPEIDYAIQKFSDLNQFLRQDLTTPYEFEQSSQELRLLFSDIAAQ